MSKIKEIIGKHNIEFWTIELYLILLILLPKSFSSIGILPIRLLATFFVVLIFLIQIFRKKVELNNNKYKFLTFIFFMFLVFTIPSLFVTKNIIISLYTFVKFAIIYIMFLVVYKYNFKKEEYNIFLNTVLCLIIILSIYGIIQYIFNINLFKMGISYYPGSLGRINTTFFNTIYYGIFINLFFGIIFYNLCKCKDRKKTIIILLICELLYINIILTFTRSALLIFFTILIALILFLYKISFNFKTLIYIILICITTFIIPGANKLVLKSLNDGIIMFSKVENVLSFLPDFSSQTDIIDSNKEDYKDYDDNSQYVDYSLQHREEFAKIAKEIAKENLYTGVGFGAYIDYMNSKDFSVKHSEFTLSYTHPHSSFVLLYAEVSIYALIFLLIFLFVLTIKPVVLFFDNFKVRNDSYNLSILCILLTCGFIAVNAIAENAIYDTQIFPLFLLMYCALYNNIKRKNNKVIFIASTGGHLNELLQLKPLFKKYNSYLITEKTKSTIDLKNKFEHVNYLVYGTKDHKFMYIFKFLYNFFKSLVHYIRIRPDVIVTTGTHTAVPICYIGKLFDCKIIFIETFANSKTKTLSGKLIYPIADTFIVQWEEMLKLYPRAKYVGWIY